MLNGFRATLPADTTLHAWVYEDGDPFWRLAHYTEQHTYGDPPTSTHIVTRDEGKRHAGPFVLFPSQKPTLLTEGCDAQGHIILGKRSFGVRFTLSLLPWMGENTLHRYVFFCVERKYRPDQYTDEHRQIAERHRQELKARMARLFSEK